VTAAQPDTKCLMCGRTTETHAPGCSLCDCPHRHAEVWRPADGAQGFPGVLAEDRIIRRRAEKDSAVPMDIEDL
jgi:hypothetical protein